MSNRFPLVLDTDENQIKELSFSENLDLSGSGIVNAASIEVNGIIDTTSININGRTLKEVAFTNNYQDLDNTPVGFSGNYDDLTNKPTIAKNIRNLEDVENVEPSDGQALIYNAETMSFEPKNIVTQVDLSVFDLNDLGDVTVIGTLTDRFLKFSAGSWRPSKVQWSEIQNKPINLSAFTNDVGYLTSDDLSGIDGNFTGSVFAEDETLLVDGTNARLTFTNNTSDDLSEGSNNLYYSDSYVDAHLSGGIGVSYSSGEISIGQSVGESDNVVFSSVTTESLSVTGVGTTTISSGSDVDIDATNRVKVVDTPFRLARFTTLERDSIGSPQNGDMIYNTDTNKFQGYSNGAWADLN